jgi:hypothetical protein
MQGLAQRPSGTIGKRRTIAGHSRDDYDMLLKGGIQSRGAIARSSLQSDKAVSRQPLAVFAAHQSNQLNLIHIVDPNEHSVRGENLTFFILPSLILDYLGRLK